MSLEKVDGDKQQLQNVLVSIDREVKSHLSHCFQDDSCIGAVRKGRDTWTNTAVETARSSWLRRAQRMPSDPVFVLVPWTGIWTDDNVLKFLRQQT